MQVVCFGDSNTYGYDPRSRVGGRYAKNSRWMDLLAAKTGWDILPLGAWVPDESLVNASCTLARAYKALAEELGIRFADGGRLGCDTGL